MQRVTKHGQIAKHCKQLQIIANNLQTNANNCKTLQNHKCKNKQQCKTVIAKITITKNA